MLDLLLVDGDGTATTLSERLPVTRQAVAKHLGVLDRVGLVQGDAGGPGEAVPGRRGPARPGRGPAAVGRRRAGTPGCSGSSGSPRRSSAASRTDRPPTHRTQDHDPHHARPRSTTTTKESNQDGGHSAPGRRQDATPDKVYDALTTVEASPAGGPTTRRGAPRSAACSSSGSPPAASTWRSSSSTRPSGWLAGRRRARGVDRHDDRLGAPPGRTTTRSCCSSTRAGRSRWSSCTTAAPSGRRT